MLVFDSHSPHDVVATAIRKARATYTPPASCPDIDPGRIRSHSGRHRSINDMKACDVPREIGKRVARINDDKVWDNYGRVTSEQAGTALKRNRNLQESWNGMY